jgi:hypothetical protein
VGVIDAQKQELKLKIEELTKNKTQVLTKIKEIQYNTQKNREKYKRSEEEFGTDEELADPEAAPKRESSARESKRSVSSAKSLE